MPTYDYQCRSCGETTEVIHAMTADGPTVCDRCGGELRRVLYPAGIIFKGSGFYRTDSRPAGGSGGGSGGSGGKGSSTSTSSKDGGDGSSKGTADSSKGSGTGSSGSGGSGSGSGSGSESAA